jgi:FixJ family two-component response regulator
MFQPLRASDVAAPSANESARRVAPEAVDRRDCVLVVDSNPEALDRLAARLASSGSRVLTTNEFQSAVDVLAHEPVDCVVAAVRLGAFNGLHLAVKLQGTGTAVVITHEKADEIFAGEARKVGALFIEDPENNPEFDRAFDARWSAPVTAGHSASR